MTTSWTEADVEALEDAIKRGVLRVRFENREVFYNSSTEMLKLLQTMKDAVARSTSGTNTSRTSYGAFRKFGKRYLGDQ